MLGYADCGSYGALDELSVRTGAKRLPGLHCYDLYAGADAIEAIFAAEPGTYLLTDYLIRSFDRSVIQPLGLDRHPERWTDYFGHYTRLVWRAQEATTEPRRGGRLDRQPIQPAAYPHRHRHRRTRSSPSRIA